jgi:hypothetical protein
VIVRGVYCFEYSVQAAVISLALLRGIRGHQAVKDYQRDTIPLCIVCGDEIEHEQPAFQLNEETVQIFTPTFSPLNSLGLMHPLCLGEITDHVWQTLEPAAKVTPPLVLKRRIA